jgi:hypothetical protein
MSLADEFPVIMVMILILIYILNKLAQANFFIF